MNETETNEYIARNENRMRPSSWLRLHHMQKQLALCADCGASADLYYLPELPQELLDRLDSIELEHLGPVAQEVGEASCRDDNSDVLELDSGAPHRLFVEVQTHEFKFEKCYGGGHGYMSLYTSETKPNVMYLLESDGESGCWLGTRFGHFDQP